MCGIGNEEYFLFFLLKITMICSAINSGDGCCCEFNILEIRH